MKPKTINQVQNEIDSIKPNEFKVIEQFYKNGENHYTLKHLVCGYEFKVKLSNFKRSYNCPKCIGMIFNKTTDYFKEEIKDFLGDDYVLLSEYKNCHAKVKMLHLVCNKEYEVTPTRILSGDKCPHCSHNKQKNTEIFSKEINEKFNGLYEVKGEYINNKTKVKILCNDCKNIFEAAPNMMLFHNNGCPYCFRFKKSKKVKFINDYLTLNNINFLNEKTFKNCKDKNLLPFDFYLEDYNCLIEFDGIQHFNSGKSFNKDLDSFNKTHKHDLIKNNYCKDNNINLIRIPYKMKENEIKELLSIIINEEDLNDIINKFALLTIINKETTNDKKYYKYYNV